MSVAVEAALAGKSIIWGAPVYDQVRVSWDETEKAAWQVAEFHKSEMIAEFPGGGRIIYRSLDNPDNARGRSADGAVIDECADVDPTAWHDVLRPMLIDTGGWAWLIGTPKGLNWFHAGFVDALSRDDSMAWQVPTVGARIEDGRLIRVRHPFENPFIPWSEIVDMFATQPERTFRQEILAEFNQGDGAVFRNVDACLHSAPTKPSEHRGHTIVGGIDWGKVHDFTALSLICVHCEREVFLDRFNQIGWAFQRDRILKSLNEWGLEFALAENNSIGSPNLEALRDDAPESMALAGFETTNKSKNRMIEAMALAFEKATIQWLADPIARHELIAYEAKKTETGLIRYGAPPGGFDDTVIARGLAWKAAAHRIPRELTIDEKIEADMPAGLRREVLDAVPPGYQKDLREMMRDFKLAEKKKERPTEHWSGEVMSDKDDVWQNGYGE
jgi:hypothetical protein